MSVSQFSRSAMLYGDEAQKNIESATVMVCGVGAVGTFAIEALARLGVGNFILIDCDVVEITNINRQICALHSTLGKTKTSVMKDRIVDINPNVKVEVLDLFISTENVSNLISRKPDVIVDAIDCIASKVELAVASLRAGVPIVSSMGAARKTNPALVETAELFKTRSCPLAARLRKEMRNRGFKKAQKCVFSTETVSADSHKSTDGEESKKIIASTPLVTGVFGLMLANLALEYIIE